MTEKIQRSYHVNELVRCIQASAWVVNIQLPCPREKPAMILMTVLNKFRKCIDNLGFNDRKWNANINLWSHNYTWLQQDKSGSNLCILSFNLKLKDKSHYLNWIYNHNICILMKQMIDGIYNINLLHITDHLI